MRVQYQYYRNTDIENQAIATHEINIDIKSFGLPTTSNLKAQTPWSLRLLGSIWLEDSTWCEVSVF